MMILWPGFLIIQQFGKLLPPSDLRQDSLDYLAVDVGESVVAALETIG